MRLFIGEKEVAQWTVVSFPKIVTGAVDKVKYNTVCKN